MLNLGVEGFVFWWVKAWVFKRVLGGCARVLCYTCSLKVFQIRIRCWQESGDGGLGFGALNFR